MAGVLLERVSRVFAESAVAVDRLSLEVLDGELLTLVGPSGCGKTTTLRLIAGLDRPTAGNISIGGRCVTDVAARERNVAMVFQNPALYPHLTAGENLTFPLALRNGGGRWLRRLGGWLSPSIGRRQRETRRQNGVAAREAAVLLGIETLLQRWPDELSGGEAQRVALARALVRRPALLLLDEPLSNADLQRRTQLRPEIKRLHRELACTTIHVTHDQTEALALGDRVAVMNRGALQQVGRPQEVYDCPANRFVAEFIGNPPMNFLRGTLTKTDEHWEFRCPAGKSAASRWRFCSTPQLAGPIDFGVRPEHLRVTAENSATSGRFRGIVHEVQSWGEATLISVRLTASGPLGWVNWIAKALGRPIWNCGESVGLDWDDEHTHYFDAATGENIEKSSAIRRFVALGAVQKPITP